MSDLNVVPIRRDVVVSEHKKLTGTVKYFNEERGFGFISQDNGGDVFVHVTGLSNGIKCLIKEQPVSFVLVEGRDGRTQAQNVLVSFVDRAKAAMPVRKKLRKIKATLKWFDPRLGYGFVILDNVPGDVFLSKKVLQRAGMNTNERLESLPVYVQINNGSRPDRRKVTRIFLE